jgi:hypothetical protein
MRKRRKALLWTLIGLLFVFAVAFVFTPPGHRNNQPVYKGLTLAQWLDVVARHRVNGYFTTYKKGRPPAKDATPEEIKEAEDAIRAIGTNAYPCLLEWTGYKPGLAKRRFFGRFVNIFINSPPVLRMLVTDKIWNLTHRRERLADQAVHGFRVLHTNAFAFETLSEMASDTNNPWMQIPAAKVLLTITNTPAR